MPGDAGPEAWVWDQLRKNADENAAEFGIDADELRQRTRRIDAIFDGGAGRPAEIAKYKMAQLAEFFDRAVSDLCRTMSSIEAKRKESEIQPLITDLAEVVNRWRTNL